MAATPEGRFYMKARADLATLPSTKFTKIQQVGRVGDSDIMLCVAGHYVEIELKKDSRTWPDPLQLWNLHEANRCLGYGFVGHPSNWDELFSFLQFLAGTEKERLEVPRCLKLRPIKPGVKPSSPLLK